MTKIYRLPPFEITGLTLGDLDLGLIVWWDKRMGVGIRERIRVAGVVPRSCKVAVEILPSPPLIYYPNPTEGSSGFTAVTWVPLKARA